MKRLRLAAYAVCVDGDQILLARYVSPARAQCHWTLPGGGIEHAEDPIDGVVREVAEETGYDVRVERLLGVDSRTRVVEDGVELQNVGVFYRAGITGGELRNETGGSTDLAQWTPIARVGTLERSVVIDIGLGLHRTTPGTGHIDPIPVGGLLRY